jgi:hypothetical protein
MIIDTDYLGIIKNNLPRILSLFDNDQFSQTYGVGDRNYWAWAQSDFINGTHQGFANGIAKLYTAGLLEEYFTNQSYVKFVDSIFEGTKRSQNKNGSLNEAFPNEQSWCVTSLVAYDLLTTLENLDPANREKKIQSINPMIEFIGKNREDHAFISNHLATGAAALLKWQKITGDAKFESKAEKLINDIVKSGSSEGWFREYGGFDPGYQTITTQYLVEIFKLRPDLDPNNELDQSIEFISNFFNPDGSYGGMIGSRQTKFFFPGGFHLMASTNDLAKKISNTAKNRIIKNQIVNLNAIDLGNLAPMFNSYCIAALNPIDREIGYLELNLESRRIFTHSGIIIDTGQNHKTILSLQKGGIVQHYIGEKEIVIDCGAIVEKKNGKLGTTQHDVKNINFSLVDSIVKIESSIHGFARQLPTPAKFAMIRILAVTVFQIPAILSTFKKLLVKKLITNQKNWKIKYSREIILGENLQIKNTINLPKNMKIVSNSSNFSPIHMASRGYWQRGDYFDDSKI